jgi:hypothetical protein
MSATSLSRITRPARAAAKLLTLGLFTVGSFPAAGQAFPGARHWVAHLTVYALIAFAFGLGWPLRPTAHVVALVRRAQGAGNATAIARSSRSRKARDGSRPQLASPPAFFAEREEGTEGDA